MILTQTVSNLNGLNLEELKALGQELMGRLLASEMQNGRMSTVDEVALNSVFNNAEGSLMRVESKNNGIFEMNLERFYIKNDTVFGNIEMEFYNYNSFDTLTEEDIYEQDEEELYRCLDINIADIESVNVHSITNATIKTYDDEITFYVL